MFPEHEDNNGHARFHELSALSNTGELTSVEWSELKEHLARCEDCQKIHVQYQVLDRQGMSMLRPYRRPAGEQHDWDISAARRRIMARVQSAGNEDRVHLSPSSPELIAGRLHASHLLRDLAFACLFVVALVGSYWLGSHSPIKNNAGVPNTTNRPEAESRAANIQAIRDELGKQKEKIQHLEAEAQRSERYLAKMRSALENESGRVKELTASGIYTENQLHAALQHREALAEQLKSAEQDYEAARAELVTLRAERDRTLLKVATLDSKIETLSAVNRDQERRLRDSEQYLASDRDIRELMGARKLYIADVFDIDSKSQTRKPFGRVFYTQGKSLIFYAFDLDQGAGIKNVNASSFQVWGKKGSAEGQPFNLGILYHDSAANRRWVLRFDDPKQLAEINAVFVTVEPNGGSRKPTGKPFLYALLRTEANHP